MSVSVEERVWATQGVEEGVEEGGERRGAELCLERGGAHGGWRRQSARDLTSVLDNPLSGGMSMLGVEQRGVCVHST